VSTHDFCGLDFGTSNSTIGVFNNNQIYMVPLEGDNPTIRSSIFFDYEKDRHTFGTSGIHDYLSGTQGRLMMSLKSVLGSSIMQEATHIHNRMVPYADILGLLIHYIKTKAEATLGFELTGVVLGRPVRFHDWDDSKDRLAQDTLEGIARKQGFKTVLFQYEPIAAALTYEQTVQEEEIALIVDLGGGTSDFSVIRLNPARIKEDRTQDVLSNKGIHIGGTDFDTCFSLETIMPELGLGDRMQGISTSIPIPSSYYYDLTTWHTINSLYTHRTHLALEGIRKTAFNPEKVQRLINVIQNEQGHKVINEIEKGKCLLSDTSKITLDLKFMDPNFTLGIERQHFENTIQEKVIHLIQTITETLQDAQLKPSSINSIFFTGGSTQIPIIRNKIEHLFPTARFIRGDVFSSVGKGLILDAKRRLGT
jgi:hypothetical chaperone protein